MTHLLHPALLAALAFCAPAHADTLPRTPAPACEAHEPRHDRKDIRCTLGAATAMQRFHFQARFSGSHDDTTASLSATVNGKELVCGPGSKTLLEGEDGDVTLDCRFTIAPEGGATPVLRVLLAWHHARYTDFTLKPE